MMTLTYTDLGVAFAAIFLIELVRGYLPINTIVWRGKASGTPGFYLGKRQSYVSLVRRLGRR